MFFIYYLVKKLVILISRSPSSIYQFDHVYPGSKKEKVVIILYAEMGTQGFIDFHPALVKLALNGEVTYVVRHFVKVLKHFIMSKVLLLFIYFTLWFFNNVIIMVGLYFIVDSQLRYILLPLIIYSRYCLINLRLKLFATYGWFIWLNSSNILILNNSWYNVELEMGYKRDINN